MNPTRQVPEKTLFISLEKTARHVREKMNRNFSRIGLNITFDQSIVLEEIFIRQGISQKRLADNLSKDPASVSRILSLLENKNFISRKASRTNAKEKKLYLTPDGYQLAEDIIKQNRKTYKEVFLNAHIREQNLIIDVLKRIYS